MELNELWLKTRVEIARHKTMVQRWILICVKEGRDFMRRRYKWNGKRLVYNIAIVLAVAVINMFVLNLLYNIEDYSTIAKYQLENDLKSGNVQAAAYCQEKASYIDMEQVADYQATEHGVYLQLEDGSGYFLEKSN